MDHIVNQPKFFLGTLKRRWNPQTQPYISGVRYRIHVLDQAESNFRLRKFLRFLLLASRKNVKTIFVLRPHYSFLSARIVPQAFYAPFYNAGLLSNFRSTLVHFQKTKASYYLPTFPGIAVFLNEYDRMDHSLNEAARTRTPAMFFGDNSMNLNHASYGVLGRIHDAGSASFVVSLCLSVIKRGNRLRKTNFRAVYDIFMLYA